MVGARYEVRACRSTRQLELVPCGGKEAERAFTVSRRERNGVVVPLLEFRSPVLRELFSAADRVRVVIRLGRILITEIDKDRKVAERLHRLQQKIRQSVLALMEN